VRNQITSSEPVRSAGQRFANAAASTARVLLLVVRVALRVLVAILGVLEKILRAYVKAVFLIALISAIGRAVFRP